MNFIRWYVANWERGDTVLFSALAITCTIATFLDPSPEGVFFWTFVAVGVFMALIGKLSEWRWLNRRDTNRSS